MTVLDPYQSIRSVSWEAGPVAVVTVEANGSNGNIGLLTLKKGHWGTAEANFPNKPIPIDFFLNNAIVFCDATTENIGNVLWETSYSYAVPLPTLIGTSNAYVPMFRKSALVNFRYVITAYVNFSRSDGVSYLPADLFNPPVSGVLSAIAHSVAMKLSIKMYPSGTIFTPQLDGTISTPTPSIWAYSTDATPAMPGFVDVAFNKGGIIPMP